MLTSEKHSIIHLTCQVGTHVNKAFDEGIAVSKMIADVTIDVLHNATHMQFMNGEHLESFTD